MPLFLGLDCGGSSTRALALDESENVVFQGQGGPGNVASTPPRKFLFSLENAVRGCGPVDYVCGCFAGLLTEEDRLRAEETLRNLFPKAQVRATPDYAAALYASDEGTDVCVIAGTGSLVCSSGPGGLVKSGGRGYLLGDHGSGFRYGREALLAYLSDPKNASEELRCAVLKLFGTEDEAHIVSHVYRQGSPPATLARLAKPFASDAVAGKPYATKALALETDLLTTTTSAHIREHFPGKRSLGICLAGGLWQTTGIFRDAYMRVLKEKTEQVEIVGKRIKHPPVVGAVRLAREISNGN